MRVSTLTTSIQRSTGNSSQNNKLRKRNKRHTYLRGRNKIALICKLHDFLHRKFQIIYPKFLELISIFSKIAGNKINTQKSIIFLFFFSGCVTRHVGSQFPDQGLNPRPLHWKRGPPGKSPYFYILTMNMWKQKFKKQYRLQSLQRKMLTYTFNKTCTASV